MNTKASNDKTKNNDKTYTTTKKKKKKGFLKC